MNESIKKYSKVLAEIILNAKKDEVEEYLSAFIEMLKDSGAVLSIESIIREARAMAQRDLESRTVDLRHAGAFDEQSESRMKESIRAEMRKQGKEAIFINESKDESLISGAVIDFPGMRVDASLSGRIQRLAEQMKS